jgi:hypothetical protein
LAHDAQRSRQLGTAGAAVPTDSGSAKPA